MLDAGHSHLAAVQASPICSDSVTLSPFVSGNLGPSPLLHDTSREGAAGAPLLGLGRLAWAEGGFCFEADCEGRAFPCEDLLQAFSFLRSVVKALREPYLSVVQERPGGCEAALGGYDSQWHRAEGS